MHSLTTHRCTSRRSHIALALYAALGITPALCAAASAPVGPEFQVNTFTTDNQESPAVAMDADGDFVIVWQSGDFFTLGQDGGQGGIYAQRYDAAGNPQGGEFRVNNYTTGEQNSPAVAMDDDGDFVVAWQSHLQDGDHYGIYAQRYDAAGNPQGGEFRVNTFTRNAQRFPAVAMDAGGDFVVTWESFGQDSSSSAIYAQRYSADGLPQGGGFRVNTFSIGAEALPAVAMDDDGDFVVTWESSDQEGYYDGHGIYAQRYDAAGNRQGSEFHINTFTAGDQRRPAVAMDSDGDFVVTWDSSNPNQYSGSIHARRYDAAGNPQSSEFQVNASTAASQQPSAVAMDVDGDFVVTWTSASIYAQRYDATGIPQGGEFQVDTFSTDSQFSSVVAMDADGDFVVTWTSYRQDGSREGIYAQRYRLCAGECDEDGVPDADDNCPFVNNPEQTDADTDGAGDACDQTPLGQCLGRPVSIRGTDGDDVLTGTPGNDVIAGLAGNDQLLGGDGNDILCTGAGDDLALGGLGNDILLGETGNNQLLGEAGKDFLRGGPGNDILNDGADGDALLGGFGDDGLDGGDGTDRLIGGPGTDTCTNGEQVDECEP